MRADSKPIRFNGGSAFPVIGPGGKDSDGMTLRDYFAAHALPVLLLMNPPGESDEPPNVWAESAYDFADAMLEERKL